MGFVINVKIGTKRSYLAGNLHEVASVVSNALRNLTENDDEISYVSVYVQQEVGE